MIATILIATFTLGVGFYLTKNYNEYKIKLGNKVMHNYQKYQVKKWADIVRKEPSEENKAQLRKWKLVFELSTINRYVKFLQDTGRYSICTCCDYPKDITYPTCTFCNSLVPNRSGMSPQRIEYVQREEEENASIAMLDWLKNN